MLDIITPATIKQATIIVTISQIPIVYSPLHFFCACFLQLILPLLVKTIRVIAIAQTAAQIKEVHHQEPIV